MPRFLAVSEQSPHLRLLDVPSMVESIPPGLGSLFIDDALLRDGWVALGYNMRAWGLDAGLDSAPILFQAGAHPAAHEDPRLLWLTTPDDTAVAVDQGGRMTGERIALRPGDWLAGAFGGQCVVWNPESGTTTYRAADGTYSGLPRAFVQHVHGPFAFLWQTGGGRAAFVLDLRSGEVKEISPVGSGTWDLRSSLSPDGSRVAITVQLADPDPARPEGMPIAEWMRLRKGASPRDQRRAMCVVDLETATRRVAELTLEKGVNAPAWTQDSAALLVDLSDDDEHVLGRLNVEDMEFERSLVSEEFSRPLVDVTGWQ